MRGGGWKPEARGGRRAGGKRWEMGTSRAQGRRWKKEPVAPLG
jgi:hypothetical protein